VWEAAKWLCLELEGISQPVTLCRQMGGGYECRCQCRASQDFRDAEMKCQTQLNDEANSIVEEAMASLKRRYGIPTFSGIVSNHLSSNVAWRQYRSYHRTACAARSDHSDKYKCHRLVFGCKMDRPAPVSVCPSTRRLYSAKAQTGNEPTRHAQYWQSRWKANAD
jgi:hypothetical protein